MRHLKMTLMLGISILSFTSCNKSLIATRERNLSLVLDNYKLIAVHKPSFAEAGYSRLYKMGFDDNLNFAIQAEEFGYNGSNLFQEVTEGHIIGKIIERLPLTSAKIYLKLKGNQFPKKGNNLHYSVKERNVQIDIELYNYLSYKNAIYVWKGSEIKKYNCKVTDGYCNFKTLDRDNNCFKGSFDLTIDIDIIGKNDDVLDSFTIELNDGEFYRIKKKDGWF